MLKAYYTNESEIPEELRSYYGDANENGLYILKVTPQNGYALEDVSGLKSAMLKTKGKLDLAKDKLKNYPEDFDPEKYEKDRKKFADNNNFDIDVERRNLKVEIQKQIEDNYKETLNKKDAQIDKYRQSVSQSALNDIYGKVEAMGIDKMLIEGYVKKITNVDINEDGYSLGFIDGEGGKKQIFDDESKSIRDYSVDDFIKDLPNHDVYGKLIASKASSGNGAGNNYQSQPQSTNGIKYISESEVNNHLEGIADGSVQVRTD